MTKSIDLKVKTEEEEVVAMDANSIGKLETAVATPEIMMESELLKDGTITITVGHADMISSIQV